MTSEASIEAPEPAAEVWAIVVAGGSGARYGRLKQLDALAGRRVLDWSIDAMGLPGRTVVVLPADQVGEVAVDAVVVAGGSTRSASVRAGLSAVGPNATHVLVHDAARPLVTPEVVAAVIDGLAAADGAIPVVPVTDTLRRVDGEPVDRSDLVAVQTPQGFGVEILRRSHASGEDATDDATLVTALGGSVVHVDGDATNIKITVPTDRLVAEVILNARATDNRGSD